MDFSMVIMPIHSDVKTGEAHVEVLSSPLFKTRLRNARSMFKAVKEAIKNGNVATIACIAEKDTSNLHTISITGKRTRGFESHIEGTSQRDENGED